MAAAVAVLVAEATEQLGGGMPPLGRCGLVLDQDPVDGHLGRPEAGSGSVPGRRLGMGLGMLEGLSGGRSGAPELAGDLPDGHAIASRPPNRA